MNGNESYTKTYELTDVLKHDTYPEASVAYAARVKKSHSLDELTLTEALAIQEEVELWKESMRVEFTSRSSSRSREVIYQHSAREWMGNVSLGYIGRIHKYRCSRTDIRKIPGKFLKRFGRTPRARSA